MCDIQTAKNFLAQDFGLKSLPKFAFPTIIMMLLMGLYTIADTIFVARFLRNGKSGRRRLPFSIGTKTAIIIFKSNLIFSKRKGIMIRKKLTNIADAVIIPAGEDGEDGADRKNTKAEQSAFGG